MVINLKVEQFDFPLIFVFSHLSLSASSSVHSSRSPVCMASSHCCTLQGQCMGKTRLCYGAGKSEKRRGIFYAISLAQEAQIGRKGSAKGSKGGQSWGLFQALHTVCSLQPNLEFAAGCVCSRRVSLAKTENEACLYGPPRFHSIMEEVTSHRQSILQSE